MADPKDRGDRAGSRGLAWAVFLAIGTGVFLRFWNLEGQILGGDELHAVRAAAAMRPAEILTHYSLTDYPLPLTALASALLGWGVPLDEMAFRWPSLVAGIAVVILFPLLALRMARIDAATVGLFAWLLALSPALVLYSRIARSYMPMVFASTLAVALFAGWWERRRWPFAAGYVVAGALAVWLHLGAAPIVVSPFLYALVSMARKVIQERGSHQGARKMAPILGDLRRSVAVGLAMMGAWSLFLYPAWDSLVHLVSAKQGESDPTPRAAWAVMRIQAGADSAWVAAVFWLAAVVGLVLLWRRRPSLAGWTVAAVGGHVAGLLLLAPSALGQPIALNRYLLPIFPFVLLWVAVALAVAWSPAPAAIAPAAGAARRAPRVALRFALVTAISGWVAVGPLAKPAFLRGSFAHHNAFVAFVVPPPRSLDREAVEVYDRLPPGPVLETPWYAPWDASRALAALQLEHGRRVLVAGFEDQLPVHPSLRFRNALPFDLDAMLASPAVAVVVHQRLGREEDTVEGGIWGKPRLRARALRRLRSQSATAVARLTAAWGPPDVSGGSLEAWNLERVRAQPGKPGLEADPVRN